MLSSLEAFQNFSHFSSRLLQGNQGKGLGKTGCRFLKTTWNT